MLVPLIYLVLRALEADPATLRDLLWRPRTAQLLGNTLALTASVLAASTLLALPLAWLTTRSDLPARGLWVVLGALPLAVPGYVGAYALLAASGTNGVIHALGGIEWPRPSGFLGAVGILALFNFPYLFLNFRTALRGLDPSLEEAARSLGHRPGRVWWTVVVPQLRPAFYAGALLVGLHVLGDFGVVSLMRFETFSYAIYLQYSASFDRVYAAALSLVLLGLTGAALLLEARLLRGLRLSRVGGGAARRHRTARLGAWRWPALAFVGLLAGATLVVPLGAVAYWLGAGLARGSADDLPAAFWNSASAAAPAAVLAVALALPLAYLGVRHPSPLSRSLERSAYLGYATPPLALALAFVFFALRAWPGAYQTLGLLVAAYTLHFLAEAVGPLRTAIYQASPRLEEAARGLGLNAASAFARATLPLVRGGLVVSLALVFVSALKELPLTFLLAPIGFDTLATTVWGYTTEAMFAEAAPYALGIVLASSLFAILVLGREREA